jgi:HEPN domain-containing protein
MKPEWVGQSSMTPFTEEAQRLLRLAERDMQTFRILAAHPEAALASTCFHAQQCAEKALKAVLTLRHAHFPRTHNLEELAQLVGDLGLTLPLPARELRRLSPFAIEFRYDDEAIPLLTQDEAASIVLQTFNWARCQVEKATNAQPDNDQAT